MKSVNRFVVTCRRTATREFERSSKSGTRNFRASSIPGPSAATIMTIGNETIQLRLEDRTAWITLERPPLNILDISMMQALDAVLERALSKCDFVIFQGAGPQAFSAGEGLGTRALKNRSEEHTSELQSRLHLVCRLLLDTKKEHSPPSGRASPAPMPAPPWNITARETGRIVPQFSTLSRAAFSSYRTTAIDAVTTVPPTS